MLIYLDRYNFSDPTVEATPHRNKWALGIVPAVDRCPLPSTSATTGILRTARF
jgi:hypothetical protein